jgi:hypothetical protein
MAHLEGEVAFSVGAGVADLDAYQLLLVCLYVCCVLIALHR